MLSTPMRMVNLNETFPEAKADEESSGSTSEDDEALKEGLKDLPITPKVRHGADDSEEEEEEGEGGEEDPIVDCSVCWSDTPRSQMFRSDCGHSFCRMCWQGHFQQTILQGDVLNIRCMQRDCKGEITVEQVGQLVDPETFGRYQQFLLLTKIRVEHPEALWCPSPQCNTAFYGDALNKATVHCPNCNLDTCVACRSVAHPDQTCEAAAKQRKKDQKKRSWREKRRQKQSERWISRHTTLCERCQTPVQKRGGCKHMSCRCGYEFCWSCRREWHSAGGYGHICMFRSHGSVKHKIYRVGKDLALIVVGAPLVLLVGTVFVVGTIGFVAGAVVLAPILVLTS